jgi:hypothetical protein
MDQRNRDSINLSNHDLDMKTVESWGTAMLGLIGFGLGKTLLFVGLTGVVGILVNLFWSIVASGVGYCTKLFIDWIRTRIRIFMSNRTKKPK